MVFCRVCCSRALVVLAATGERVAGLGGAKSEAFHIWGVKSQGNSPGTLQPKPVCCKVVVVGEMQVVKAEFPLDKKQCRRKEGGWGGSRGRPWRWWEARWMLRC